MNEDGRSHQDKRSHQDEGSHPVGRPAGPSEGPVSEPVTPEPAAPARSQQALREGGPAPSPAATPERGEQNAVGSDPEDRDQDEREPWFERVLGRFGLRSRESIRTDLEDVLASTAENEGFSAQERAMLRNVLGFHSTRVRDAMVPRADIIAVSAETPLGELLRIFRSAGHSRLPVYGETLDDPKGMIHIRDFLEYLVAKAENGNGRRRRSKTQPALSLDNIDLTTMLSATRILRPVLFVPPSMPAVELLVRMQTTRTHMALVIDEYGGTDGLVSIEDLVELIVGDIEDEHDLASAAMIEQSGPYTWLADARTDLEEASQALGIDLTSDDLAEDVDTLGGLIVTLAGRVPARSELIAGPEGLEFEILDADPRRLKRVRVHRRDPRAKIAPPRVTARDSGDKQPDEAAALSDSAAAPPEDTGMPNEKARDSDKQAASPSSHDGKSDTDMASRSKAGIRQDPGTVGSGRRDGAAPSSSSTG